MNTETKVLAIVGLITVVLLFGGVFFLSSKQPSGTKTNEGLVYNMDYSKGQKIGSDSAKVKLVEFGDFQCPACKSFEPAISQIRANPNVQFYFVHFPLYPNHKFARMAADAAEEAASQGKFWEMHDRLYATQDSWSVKDDATEDFVNLAKEVGIDGDKVREAIKSEAYFQKVQADQSYGASLDVNATPTFYLNGRKLNSMAPADLIKEVEAEVAK